jgi:hypothetical protein
MQDAPHGASRLGFTQASLGAKCEAGLALVYYLLFWRSVKKCKLNLLFACKTQLISLLVPMIFSHLRVTFSRVFDHHIFNSVHTRLDSIKPSLGSLRLILPLFPNTQRLIYILNHNFSCSSNSKKFRHIYNLIYYVVKFSC